MKGKLRGLVVFLLLISYLVVPGLGQANAATTNVSVYLDGNKLSFSKNPYLYKNNWYVQFDTVFKKLGYKFTIKKNKITFIKKGYSNHFEVGKKTIYVNGKKKTLSVPTQKINSKVFIPLNAIPLSSNKAIRWSKNKKTVYIEKRNPEIKITDFKRYFSMVKGSSKDLNVVSNDTKLIDEDVIWKSLNVKIAKVDSKGVVRFLAVGTTYVTVTIPNSSSTIKIKITVTPKKVKSLSIPKSITLVVGQKYKVPLTISPADADDKAVSWNGWDGLIWTYGILDLSSNGVITALKPGTTEISVVSQENENIGAKMIVTVKEPEYTLEQAKNNTDMLNKYLNQHYGILNSPIGDWKPVFSVNKTGVNWLDVSVDWGSYEGPMPSELVISDPEKEIKKYGHIITVEERNETKKLLREFMKKVSADAIYAFPNHFIQGEFFTDGYRYPHIRVDYWSIRFLSWNNIIENYQIDTKAHWDPTLDDYNFVLNQQLTGFSFINPQDGELYTSNDAKFPVITLKKGDKIQLPLKITPEQDISDLIYSEIGFKSYLSKNIVSMDEHGVLEGLKPGEDLINITNRFCGGGLFIKIKVTE